MKCKRCGDTIEEPISEIEKIWGMCESCIHDALINISIGIDEPAVLTV